MQTDKISFFEKEKKNPIQFTRIRNEIDKITQTPRKILFNYFYFFFFSMYLLLFFFCSYMQIFSDAFQCCAYYKETDINITYTAKHIPQEGFHLFKERLWDITTLSASFMRLGLFLFTNTSEYFRFLFSHVLRLICFSRLQVNSDMKVRPELTNYLRSEILLTFFYYFSLIFNLKLLKVIDVKRNKVY